MIDEKEVLRQERDVALAAVQSAIRIAEKLEARIDKAINLLEDAEESSEATILAILRGEGETDVRAPKLQDEEGVEGGAGGG